MSLWLGNFAPSTGLIQTLSHVLPMPEVGEIAPDFELFDYNKKLRRRSEFLAKGKRTIFAFFPGAFTGTCTQEMCSIRDMLGDLERLNGLVVGISVDAPWAQKAFAEKNNLNFDLLCDFKHEVIRKYGVVWRNLGGVEGYESANRAIFVTDESAKILLKWVAPDPGALPDFEAVKKAL
jgi:glutaredoxin-dependent peroxiredoxin